MLYDILYLMCILNSFLLQSKYDYVFIIISVWFCIIYIFIRSERAARKKTKNKKATTNINKAVL